MNYPKLPIHLKTQLQAITPSKGEHMLYHPCLVMKTDGQEINGVYVEPADVYLTYRKTVPETATGKLSLAIAEVAEIRESPSRLPVKFADQLYKAGETGMGYCAFWLQFMDGSIQFYVVGSTFDFLVYPQGQSPATIVAIADPKQATRDYLGNADHCWCLYQSR